MENSKQITNEEFKTVIAGWKKSIEEYNKAFNELAETLEKVTMDLKGNR